MTPEERQELVNELAIAFQTLQASQQTECLNQEEQQWVRLAIQAEARKIKFRDAVIEKSLAGLVWSGIAGFGYILLDFLKNHGLKLT